jgi:signal transduction histidine kinase
MDPRRHTLLVVDDEVDVLESLRHLFHRSYRVLTASSGEQALDLLKKNDVHLILSDQRMPGMPGDVFLSQARRLQPDAIRILFTGYADIQAVINAVNEGNIFRYILKPWDAGELEGVIRQAAEQYELLAERKRLIAELQAANVQLTRANQELEEAGQLKSSFIEVASHEFNTPITLVLGMSELLRLLNPNRTEQEQALVDRISDSARQLARLVTNTLTLMRTDDFRQTLQRGPVDVAALLRSVVEQVLPFVQVRHLELGVDVPDDLGTAEVDADKIAACAVNLLTNAIKFTPDGGRIALSARAVDDMVEITIADRGIGLEPRAVNRLFQPFFTQFDSSLHSSGDFGFNKRGLGLGLSIVKQFVELHGGGVRAESTLGEGTTVTMSLPRHAPVETNHDPEPAPDEALTIPEPGVRE